VNSSTIFRMLILLYKPLAVAVVLVLLGVAMAADKNQCGMNTALPKSAAIQKQKQSGITNIIGGLETANHGWPWQVLIFTEEEIFQGRGKPVTTEQNQHCGGAVISRHYILTAAHCIFEKNTGRRYKEKELVFYLGRHHINETEVGAQTLRAEKITVHEDYNKPNAFDNDIALVQVKGQIYTSRTVRPVCLPGGDPRDGQLCAVTGWGMTASGTPSEYLQQVYMPIINNTYCNKVYKKTFGQTINENQICSGGNGKTDSCVGDSGGPLVCRKGSTWNLNGLVSYGPNRCATKGMPGVYIRITKYAKWIADRSGVTAL